MTIFVALILVLAGWLILSILAQFSQHKWVRWFKYYDIFALIPVWTFFAPNPGVTDFRLLYRDKLFDGQYTPWKEVEYSDSSLFCTIWNPDKRRQKAIVDNCIFLLQDIGRNIKNKSILVSTPYLVILTYVMAMPRSSLSEYRQFLIGRTFGYHTSKEPEILFISHPHKI